MTIEASIPENSTDAQYDARAKKLTEYRWVLAQIVQHVLPELEGCSVKDVMSMICSEIQRNVPLEPGQTNDPSSDPNSRLMGLNTEDKAPAEGAVFFDFVFRMQLPKEEARIIHLYKVEHKR